MAYHRTRSDKQKAQQYRQNQTNTYTYQGQGSETVSTGSTQPTTVASSSVQTPKTTQEKPLVRTDPALIKRDLVKTLVVSLLLVTLLLGMYAWTRYNGFRLPFIS